MIGAHQRSSSNHLRPLQKLRWDAKACGETGQHWNKHFTRSGRRW